MELPELPEEDNRPSPMWSPKPKPRAFVPDAKRTSLGAETGGTSLTRWHRFIRLMLSFVLPSNDYQKIKDKKDRLNVTYPELEIEVPEDTMAKETSYAIDDYVKFFKPYAAVKLKPPVLFIPCLTLSQIIIFISYSAELTGRMETVNALSGVPVYSQFIFDSTRRYEIWRFFTYALLHQGCIHFIFNMLVQVVIGIPLELAHRWWRVAIVYTLGVLTGSMFHSMVDRHAYLAGASGGVYALIGAHLSVIVMNFKDMTYGWMSFIQKVVFSAPCRLVCWIIFVIIDTILAIYTRHKISATKDDFSVGYAHHFLGLIVGVTLGYATLRSVKRRFWKDITWYVMIGVCGCLALTAVLVNSLAKDYPLTDWRGCCAYMSV